MEIQQIEKISTAIAETLTATAALNALLVLELDRRGVLDKGEFSSLLRNHITGLTEHPHDRVDGSVRHDLKLLEGVAMFLTGPPPKGWTPVVIKGGKD